MAGNDDGDFVSAVRVGYSSHGFWVAEPLGLFLVGNGLSEFAKGVLVGAIMITTVLIVFFITGDVRFDRIQFSLPFLVSWILVLIGYIFQTAAEEIYIRGWLLPIIFFQKK